MGRRILHKNPSLSLRGIKRVDCEHVFSRNPSRAKDAERGIRNPGVSRGILDGGLAQRAQVEHGTWDKDEVLVIVTCKAV